MNKILKYAFLAVTAALVATVPLYSGAFITRFLIGVILYAIMAEGWNVIAGYTGYPSFGNVVFFGLGAYITALCMINFHTPFILSLVFSSIAGALFAIIIGIPILRLKGHYFAIVTLGIGETMMAITFNVPFTGTGAGLSLPLAINPNLFYYISLIVLVIFIVFLKFILSGRLGYGMIAVREDEDAAKMMGIDTVAVKIKAFAISGFFTAIAGGIYAYWSTFIDPPTVYDPVISIKMIIMTVFGGAGTLLGPVAGAFIIMFLSDFLSTHFTILHTFFFGGLIVMTAIFLPKGLMDVLSQKGIGWKYFIENIRKHRV
ncbi:MAG: branched-chain amino acid ABC transporter permease [Epsilonproteobacteria bacterium]|nr:branched-chain amino acid ABC transporter permease [Campylobacterota bacterium]